jgi:hypothetical protein
VESVAENKRKQRAARGDFKVACHPERSDNESALTPPVARFSALTHINLRGNATMPCWH